MAVTSTQKEFCTELGADRVVDYRKEDWWTIPEYRKEKFDVIIDAVGGGNYYGRAEEVLKTAKDGGTFVAVTGDDTSPDCRTYGKLIKFFAQMIGRAIYTKLKSRSLPKYVALMPYGEAEGRREVLGWMREGKLDVRLDEDPLPFTSEGVREAFAKVGGRHAHGKVVVRVADE